MKVLWWICQYFSLRQAQTDILHICHTEPVEVCLAPRISLRQSQTDRRVIN